MLHLGRVVDGAAAFQSKAMSHQSLPKSDAARRSLRLDFSKVAQSTKAMTAEDLAQRLGGVVSADGSILCPGPGHSADDRSLHVTLTPDKPDGFIFYSHADDDLTACRDHITAAIGGAKLTAPETTETKSSREDRLAAWRDIWEVSAAGSSRVSPIRRYLTNRNLPMPEGDVLRWRPSGSMIARITDFATGETIGFHETFLDESGRKRSVTVVGEKQSRLTHVSSKGVILLSRSNSKRLVIGEGIETGLSARHIPKLRGADLVSLVNVGNYARVKIPKRYETVYVLADIEPSGRGVAAAEKLAERLSADGLRTYLVRPVPRDAESKADLNDVVMRSDFEAGADYTIERWKQSSASPFIFDGDAPIEPPPMLIKGLLGTDGIAFIGGQSGAGKSFIELDLATALASGQAFFGREAKERVGVAILAAEGAGTIARRLHAAREQRRIRGRLPIAWTGAVPNLADDRERAMMIAQLKTIDQQMRARFGVRLAVVMCDTLAAAFALKDEADNSEANRITRAMREFVDQLGVVFMPVHHFGKATETGLRGASAWRAGADVVLSVLGDRNQVTGEVSKRSLALSKTRDGEEGPISGFTLRVVQIGVDEEGTPFTTCIVEPGDVPAPRQPGKAARTYLQALDIALATKRSEDPDATYEGVDRERVREAFYRLWPATGETEKQKANARRQQFGRGEAEALDRKLIALEETTDRTLVSVT